MYGPMIVYAAGFRVWQGNGQDRKHFNGSTPWHKLWMHNDGCIHGKYEQLTKILSNKSIGFIGDGSGEQAQHEDDKACFLNRYDGWYFKVTTRLKVVEFVSSINGGSGSWVTNDRRTRGGRGIAGRVERCIFVPGLRRSESGP